MKNKILFILAISLFHIANAQNKNIFLDKGFWKSTPTIATIQQKISEGNDATQIDPHGFDGVTYAILANTPNKTIEYLLSIKGNEVNKLTHDKRTYVFWAAYKNNVALMESLISKGAKMNMIDAHHFSVLTFAAVTGQTNKKIYELCLKHGIDITTDKDEHGSNALLLLTPFLKDFEMIKYFESKGLSINSKDADGNGIFAYAAKKGNKEIIEQLILNGITAKSEKNTMIFATQASREGYNSLKFFKYLESMGVKANVMGSKNQNPLNQLAYKCSDIETLQYFLDKGVAIDNAQKDGTTPLIISGYSNTLETIKFIHKQGGTINAVNKKGHSVLTNAIQYNTVDVVKYLLKNGADANVLDALGNHLGAYVIKSFHANKIGEFKEKAALLAQYNIDITKPLANNETLYHLAVKNNDVDLLKALENYKININAKNNDGNTALHVASMTNNNDIVLKYLIEKGAKTSIKTEFGETAFDLAQENEVLQKKNIDLTFLK